MNARCGPKLIVTRVGGLPELVSDPLCVIPPNDPAGLAERTVHCLTCPEQMENMRRDAARMARSHAWDR